MSDFVYEEDDEYKRWMARQRTSEIRHGLTGPPTAGQIERMITAIEELERSLSRLLRCVETAPQNAPGRGHYLRVANVPERVDRY
jgi:hypothetical protein